MENELITHRSFFGDGEYLFCLTDEMIVELERIADTGIGVIFLQVANMGFLSSTVTAILRLGLIGGGMAPERAYRLVETYGRNRPLDELFPLAAAICDARWAGNRRLTGGDA